MIITPVAGPLVRIMCGYGEVVSCVVFGDVDVGADVEISAFSAIDLVVRTFNAAQSVRNAVKGVLHRL